MSESADGFPRLRVECYAGYRGEETPRCFYLGQRQIEITEIIDRWLSPAHRYFKVEDAEGSQYVLWYDVDDSRWELTNFVAGQPLSS